MADSTRPVTFSAIRREVTDCLTIKSEISDQVLKLLDLPNLMPLNETTLDDLHPKYYTLPQDIPTKKPLTDPNWQRLPSKKEIQKMLTSALQNIDSPVMSPSAGSEAADKKAAKELVSKINDRHYEGGRSLFGLPCEGLEKLAKVKTYPGTLDTDEYACDIMPAGAIRSLSHDDTSEISTLVIGRRIWFQYPPTPQNLRVLTDYYHKYGHMKDFNIHRGYFRNLEGGVVFIQKPGETIHISAFSIFAAYSSRTSVSISCNLRYAHNLPIRLRRVRFQKYQHSELPQFRQTLLTDLERVLTEDFSNSVVEPALDAIAASWDQRYKEHLPLWVARRLNADNWPGRLATAWGIHLGSVKDEQRSKSTCRLCSKEITKRGYKKHFLSAHWQAPKLKQEPKQEPKTRKRDRETEESALAPSSKRQRKE
jgi:hypothetical protein